MNEKEYISIKDIAEYLKKTKEETEVILKSAQYDKYIYKVKNSTLYDKEILKVIIVNDSQEKENEKPRDKAINTQYIEHLNQEIELLREQIKEKDKMIADLNQQLLLSLNKTQELVDKALNTTTQAQILHANEKTNIFRRLFANKKQDK